MCCVPSASTPSMTPGRLQRGRLGKLPSTSNLGDWFWGRTEGVSSSHCTILSLKCRELTWQQTSPTKRHPGAAEKETAEELRGKTPAYLARVQRRHQVCTFKSLRPLNSISDHIPYRRHYQPSRSARSAPLRGLETLQRKTRSQRRTPRSSTLMTQSRMPFQRPCV